MPCTPGGSSTSWGWASYSWLQGATCWQCCRQAAVGHCVLRTASNCLQAELGAGGGAVVEGAAQSAEAAQAGCPDSDEECLLGRMREEIQAEVSGRGRGKGAVDY